MLHAYETLRSFRRVAAAAHSHWSLRSRPLRLRRVEVRSALLHLREHALLTLVDLRRHSCARGRHVGAA